MHCHPQGPFTPLALQSNNPLMYFFQPFFFFLIMVSFTTAKSYKSEPAKGRDASVRSERGKRKAPRGPLPVESWMAFPPLG